MLLFQEETSTCPDALPCSLTFLVNRWEVLANVRRTPLFEELFFKLVDNIWIYMGYIWDNPSHWRTHIFQDGQNHQPVNMGPGSIDFKTGWLFWTTDFRNTGSCLPSKMSWHLLSVFGASRKVSFSLSTIDQTGHFLIRLWTLQDRRLMPILNSEYVNLGWRKMSQSWVLQGGAPVR